MNLKSNINLPYINLKIIMILSSIFSSSSSVASLFPALSFESTCLAGKQTNRKHELLPRRRDDGGGGKLSYRPMSSAGLFGRLLMKVSKASFMALTNFSFFKKQMSMMWSTLSLKSSSSWTIVLSFSGLITIVLPNACMWGKYQRTQFNKKLMLTLSILLVFYLRLQLMIN